MVAGVVALYAYFKYLLDWIKGISSESLPRCIVPLSKILYQTAYIPEKY